jgi:hypothetical protein
LNLAVPYYFLEILSQPGDPRSHQALVNLDLRFSFTPLGDAAAALPAKVCPSSF